MGITAWIIFKVFVGDKGIIVVIIFKVIIGDRGICCDYVQCVYR